MVSDSKLIAVIKNENGDSWRVHSNVTGTVCELNEQLLVCCFHICLIFFALENIYKLLKQKDPDLIRRSPTGDGWVAIVIPTRQSAIDITAEIEKQGLKKDKDDPEG